MPSTSVDCPRTSYPGKCIPSILLLLDAGSSARMPLVGLSSIIRPPYEVSSRSAQGRHSICTRWIPLVARIIRCSLSLCLFHSFSPASVRFFVTPRRKDFHGPFRISSWRNWTTRMDIVRSAGHVIFYLRLVNESGSDCSWIHAAFF